MNFRFKSSSLHRSLLALGLSVTIPAYVQAQATAVFEHNDSDHSRAGSTSFEDAAQPAQTVQEPTNQPPSSVTIPLPADAKAKPVSQLDGGPDQIQSGYGQSTGVTASSADNPPQTQPRTQGGDENIEVYTKGPLHEAFATPYTAIQEATPVISQTPPEPINEVPPEEMPEGSNIEWIPGYWAFDNDINDFLWISGVWRDIPPGRQWLPGYWTQASGGHQWVPGMWVSQDSQELSYLPQPPATLEQGPSSPAPNDNCFYVPGNWVYQSNDYQWTPGYWSNYRDNYLWTPASYQYTPAGYVYNAGYWDYGFNNRGLAYAPLAFRNGYYNNYRGQYRPNVALSSWNNLLIHLFVRPGYNNYAFGNYYGPRYAQIGYQPWFGGGNRGFSYNPILNYNNFVYGNNYNSRLQNWHSYYNDHPDYRPSATFREQQDFNRQFRDRNNNNNNDLSLITNAAIATSLNNRGQNAMFNNIPFNFTPVNSQQRDRFQDRNQNWRTSIQNRRQFEQQAIADNTQPNISGNNRDNNRGAGNSDTVTRRETFKLNLPEIMQQNSNDLPNNLNTPPRATANSDAQSQNTDSRNADSQNSSNNQNPANTPNRGNRNSDSPIRSMNESQNNNADSNTNDPGRQNRRGGNLDSVLPPVPGQQDTTNPNSNNNTPPANQTPNIPGTTNRQGGANVPDNGNSPAADANRRMNRNNNLPPTGNNQPGINQPRNNQPGNNQPGNNASPNNPPAGGRELNDAVPLPDQNKPNSTNNPNRNPQTTPPKRETQTPNNPPATTPPSGSNAPKTTPPAKSPVNTQPKTTPPPQTRPNPPAKAPQTTPPQTSPAQQGGGNKPTASPALPGGGNVKGTNPGSGNAGGGNRGGDGGGRKGPGKGD